MHGTCPNTRFPITRLLPIIASVLLFWSIPATAASSSSTPWGADYFPNFPLTTQEGKTVRFFDDLLKDKVVMINFIYTSCPDVCPLETARLREVQKILGDRVGKDVFMYSITVDPANDTPEVLKKYSEKFDAGPGWLFLTGKEEDIIEVRRKLGLYREDETELSQHVTSLIIGNQSTGQWMKSSPFENPYFLATQVGSQLHNWKLPPKEKRDYAEAPELRPISKGETLFRTRCASCHTIGGEEAGSARRQIGPDLAGVTWNREEAWLKRWLMEPDKMLAEKDPLAMALLAKWNNVPMPNLSLNRTEVEAILDYIEERSLEVTPKHHDHGDHDHGEHHHDKDQKHGDHH